MLKSRANAYEIPSAALGLHFMRLHGREALLLATPPQPCTTCKTMTALGRVIPKDGGTGFYCAQCEDNASAA